MAITFVNSAVPTGNPTTSFTVTIPTVSVDDILILSVTNRDADTAPSVTDNDTGGNAWARVDGGTGCLTAWWKRATSGTSAKTITAASLTGSSSGVLCVYRGCRGGTPYEAVSYENNVSGNESHAAITSTRNGAWIVLCIGNDTNDLAVTASPTATSPATITLRNEKLSTGGSDCSNTQCAAEQSTAGTTGTINWAQTDGANCSVAFALVPAASISITAGSYTQTGNNASLAHGYVVPIASGSYALTGNSVTLTVAGGGVTLAIESGSYGLTGRAVNILWGHRTAAASGSYGLTGNTASLRWAHRIAPNAGSYSVSGNQVGLFKGQRLTAVAGSYGLTGNAATFLWTHRVVAAAGAYALTGNATGFRWAHRIPIASGAYALAGNAVGLKKGFGVQLSSGSYALSGTNTGLRWSHALVASAGSYAIAGSNIGLRWTHRLVVDAGSYAITGGATALRRGSSLSVNLGTYTLTGADVSLFATRLVSALSGVYALSGNTVTLLHGLSAEDPPAHVAVTIIPTASVDILMITTAQVVIEIEPVTFVSLDIDVS